MSDVEIYWPDTLDDLPVREAEQQLRDHGIATETRLQPTRRGAEISVLVFLASSVLQPVLKTVFERVGDQAHEALSAFVLRLLGRSGPGRAPAAVVFESESTGAEFVFTDSLPSEAFRQALTLDPGSEAGRWVWAEDARSWVRLEQRH